MILKELITIFMVSTILILDEKRIRHNLSLVCYGFDNTPHPINPRPHGNSKGKQSYVRTLKSTKEKMSKVAVIH